MESPSRQCVFCKNEFELLEPEVYRCQLCQADFRILESDGKSPESARAWKNKLRKICQAREMLRVMWDG